MSVYTNAEGFEKYYLIMLSRILADFLRLIFFLKFGWYPA